MNTRSHHRRPPFESLERRSLMSTTAYADFNNDGLVDKAEITNPTTVTVSLANQDGSYTVSAILTAPKSKPIQGISAWNINDDGYLDLTGGGSKRDSYYAVQWVNNGDGTFRYLEPFKWRGRDPWF